MRLEGQPMVNITKFKCNSEVRPILRVSLLPLTVSSTTGSGLFFFKIQPEVLKEKYFSSAHLAASKRQNHVSPLGLTLAAVYTMMARYFEVVQLVQVLARRVAAESKSSS